MHSVVLEDGTRIEVGYKQPYSVGEYFNRTVEVKYGSLKDMGPAVAGDPEVSVSPSSGTRISTSAGPMGRTFPVAKDSPEMSIIRQNALTNAREAIGALGMGYIPMEDAAKMTKAERHQQLDSIAEDILYLAYKFVDFSSGQREVARAAEQSRLNPPSV